MATVVTEGLIRELARFRAAEGCAVSLYVDFDPSSVPTIPDEHTKLNSAIDQAHRGSEELSASRGRDCKMALRADFERLRTWARNDFSRDGARALAIFTSSADGLFRVVPLVGAVSDGFEVGPQLWLAPLVVQQGRGEGAIVAVISRERGVVYRLHGGRLEEIVDESEEVPGQHDQGGWSQARYQRHIENIVQRHIKTVGEEIDRTVRGSGRPHMVVVAPEEMRGEIESELSHEVKESIVGWTSVEAHASPEELLEHVRPLLDEADARDEAQVLARWEELRGRGERFASGWAATLEAASDARIETLLLEDGATHKAWQCPQDGRAAIVPGNCPLDGTPLEEREDGGDVAVHLTIANGGSIVRPGAGALGGEAEGVGAILRF
jgi:peptide chain release factor subunit 1